MTYTEKQMDICDIDKSEYVVAHCIAADLHWGAGIAPIVIQNMYDAEYQCRYTPKLGGYATGKCTGKDGKRFDVGDIMPVDTQAGTFVNLITKNHTHEKPTYEDLTESLRNLRIWMQANKKAKLCMPKIGCGLDRLAWFVVSNIVKGIFADTDIEIKIVYVEKGEHHGQ